MSSNICILLLILFILVILYVTVKTTNTSNPPQISNNQIYENFSVEEIEELIDTSDIQEQSLENLMIITKLDVVKKNSKDSPRFPDKHIIIEGNNLEKVQDVYFGDLKGIILSRDNVDNKTVIRVLPPNFSKYTKMKEQSEFENIEIKLKIDDPVDETQRTVLFVDEPQELDRVFTADLPYSPPDKIGDYQKGTLKILNPKDVDTTSTKKIKLSFDLNLSKETDPQ